MELLSVLERKRFVLREVQLLREIAKCAPLRSNDRMKNRLLPDGASKKEQNVLSGLLAAE
jgi:hypothetical protein